VADENGRRKKGKLTREVQVVQQVVLVRIAVADTDSQVTGNF
jgi:hypothetical protein